ncbi:MAG: hypothetical protein AAF611_02445 [Bacteroidota bacterium]
MKKRSIKSLELNKKTISTLETSKISGGSAQDYVDAVNMATELIIEEVRDVYDAITDLFED